MDSQKRGAIKRKIREFNNSWLDEDSFKGWLAPHHVENKAFCIACNRTIRCCKTDLVQHSQTVKHIKKIQNFENNGINNNNNVKDKLSHSDRVKRSEIKLAGFFAEHNVAFYVADHLIPLLKNIFIDSKIAQDISLGRSKCTNIVNNVIAKREMEKLYINLRTCKFSILIDESTDISDTKLLCILVRYVSPLNKKVKTQLLQLVALNATDCSAEKLFETFKNILEKNEIPITNIVRMASDNASVMIGCNNSFMQRLKLEVPGLITLNCICHSSALVASKACKTLPSSCENLIRGVSTYISGSAKRCAILVEFQDFFNVERKKLLKLSNTRWLVLQKCVVRLLDNWDVLKNYFTLAVLEDKTKFAETILTQLNDNSIKAYLLFLKYVLHYFNSFNALFQSRKILIHKLFTSSHQLIRDLVRNFMILDSYKHISSLNIDNEENILPLENIYVGPECENFLNTLSPECSKEIKLKCLDFYKTATQQMLKRLPYKDMFFEQLAFLEPKIALYDESRVKIKDLTYIAQQLKLNIDVSKLAYEWRILPSYFDEEQKKELASLEINEMWKQIVEFKDFNEEKVFVNLDFLIQVVFSLPHSNAEAERIFSIVADVKNKKRNRLSNDMVSAICVTRSSFEAEDINCITFEVDSRHLELHNNIWRSKSCNDLQQSDGS